jgi:hypothetical protein
LEFGAPKGAVWCHLASYIRSKTRLHIVVAAVRIAVVGVRIVAVEVRIVAVEVRIVAVEVLQVVDSTEMVARIVAAVAEDMAIHMC